MQADTLSETINGLSQLQMRYIDTATALMKTRPFLKLTDIRIAPFVKCLSIIQPTLFAMILSKQSLHSQKWWHYNNPHFDENMITEAIVNYDQNHKLAFLHLMHFATDSSLRVVSRTLNGRAAKSGKDATTNVSGFVLKKLGLQKYNGVICIIVLLRNTTHNNGRHTGERIEKSFKGKPYVFETNKEPELYHWSRILEVFGEVMHLFVDVANSQYLKQEYIEDENAAFLQKEHSSLFK
ncbi:MAG: hypothetical protein ABI361_03265 [Nitrososphaera sp.]|jgi:hypothetical protein